MAEIVEFEIKDNFCQFKLLAKTGYKSDFVKMDLNDFERIVKNKTCWYAKIDQSSGRRYVAKNVNNKTIMLHNEILDFEPLINLVVDHINNDSLDNRRDNLQTLNRADNARKEGNAGIKPKIVYRGLTVVVITTRKRFQCYDGNNYVGSSLCINKMKSKIDKYLEGK